MTAAAHLPAGPRWPAALQGAAYIASRRRFMHALGKRYGSAFTVRLPFFGPTVIISDPAVVKQFFQTRTDVVRNVEPNLDLVLGPGSTFGLQDEEHRRRRKLLVPPFHGKRMRAYEGLVEEETLKEVATWPEGREFAVLPSTNRITLNVILRAVFGAEGTEFDALRKVIPPLVALGSQLVFLPWLHRDLGRWSPWGRFLALRREFDTIVGSLIDRVAADPNLEQRDDVLSLLLQARYEDGTAMSRSDLADELLTLLAAGHETTATQLAWAVERLRRHPGVLSRLVDEVDSSGSDLLQATINEVQRNRPVIDGAARQVIAQEMPLGQWVIPHGYTVQVDIPLTHQNAYPNPDRFDPDRFMKSSPDLYSWVPFGGGTRRCLGAAFANMEMNVVLRTMLREFRLVTTNAREERLHSRGVAFAPSGGGCAVVYRRIHTSSERRAEVLDATTTS
ncbi:MAG: cytochrome family [Mycobacterium sp.]|nr:cytochrome family [Mycobacterium sp.]